MTANEKPQESLHHGESFSVGVVSLVALTVAQRALGFARGVLLGRVLGPVELGRWDLALGFFTLAAPLAVLGVPGSLGRYFDYFRVRGHLATLLQMTARVCAGAIVISMALILILRPALAQALFGTRDQQPLVAYLAIGLAAVIAGNTSVSLALAARMYRAAAGLQFAQGVSFAIFSVALALLWRPTAESAVVGYAAGSLLACVLAAPLLRNLWRRAGTDTNSPAEGAHLFWTRVVPFSGGLWAANLLTNVFDLIDRYLIVHVSRLSPDQALAQVGAYHAARLMPLVLVGLAALLGTALTPSLSRDWEEGRRDEVVRRLNLFVKGLLFALFAAATCVLLVTPLLFRVALADRFPTGPGLVPFVAAFAVWCGAIPVAQNYLWCRERAWLANATLAIGIGLNIGAGILLLPRFGVYGVAMASSLANLLTLMLVFAVSTRLGMRWHRGTWLLAVVPVALWFGALSACAALLLLCLLALRTELLFTRDERQEITALALVPLTPILARLK